MLSFKRLPGQVAFGMGRGGLGVRSGSECRLARERGAQSGQGYDAQVLTGLGFFVSEGSKLQGGDA